MSDIKWIPLEGMNLSAANLAAAEKLRKFGFAVNCGEFGSEKLTKAELCVCDVMEEKDDPNILIITSESGLYGWYRILMTGIGADFKIITRSSSALLFFDEHSSNLCLMSSDALMGQNALREKAGADFLWDLIIIDEEYGTSVPDYSLYEKNIIWKSERLLINTPCPERMSEDRERLVSLIKNVLDDESLSKAADGLEFGVASAGLDYDSPVMRYFAEQAYSPDYKRQVSFCEYTLDEADLKNLRRRTDLRSGLPAYKYGGNVFEDFDCDRQKQLYHKAAYTRSDVEDLRQFDRKLDSCLKLLDDILSGEDNRVMIYCCDRNTSNYLRKVLTCVYGADVRMTSGESFRSEDILRKLRVDDSTAYPRIIIGTDALSAVGEGLDRINHIISYELPLSAEVLERRMTRHGSSREAQRKFIIFRDTNKQFDSRMLDKILFPSLGECFFGELPSRNILLDIDCKGECLNNVIADLKYIKGYASEIDNCIDLIKKTKCDYPVAGVEKIGNSKQLAEFASLRLERLYTLFGLSADSSSEDISAACNALGGLCVLNGGRLERLGADKTGALSESFGGDRYLSQPFAAEAVKGLADAKASIDELHAADSFHLKIKQELASLTDSIQYSVLFGIWKYRVREQDSERSFRDYIKIYNDGI